MIDINGISRVLREFKNGRHKRNPCVIMGDAPEMDELFVNFRNSARIYFNDPNPTFLIIGKLEKVSDGTCGLSASFGNIAA